MCSYKVRVTSVKSGLELQIIANGKLFQVSGLRDGEVRTIDIASAMKPGDTNTITLKSLGRPGAEADVMIWDGT